MTIKYRIIIIISKIKMILFNKNKSKKINELKKHYFLFIKFKNIQKKSLDIILFTKFFFKIFFFIIFCKL